MTPGEISAFLDRANPALVGVIATARGDGSPHAVPVWYGWDGQCVLVWTDEGRQWVRNLRRDRRVAFSVQEAGPPFGAVTIRGTAEISTGGASLDGDIRRICRRYLAEEEVDGYVATWSHLHTIVRITPAAIRAWSRGY